MEVRVEIVAAFTDKGTGGNPAGIVLDADGLSPGQKLSVASEAGLSETAFVSRSDVATIKLEFFTPTRQIAHCGHATIATFNRLRELDLVPDGNLSKETIDGTRKIMVDSGVVYMEQRAPTYREFSVASADGRSVLDAIGIAKATSVIGGLTIVDTGNPFLVVQLDGEDSVRKLGPDFEKLSRVSESLDFAGCYAFSTETRRPARHAGTRMFAPRYGIPEESATGMAAGTLACYLHDSIGIPETIFAIEQGYLMAQPSPSVIEVILSVDSAGKIQSLMAGGTAKRMREMVVQV